MVMLLAISTGAFKRPVGRRSLQTLIRLLLFQK
jgi:hypothetical protein